MSDPRSSHAPGYLKDASLDLTARFLPAIATVALVVVSAIAYTIFNNNSKYPLANPPGWFQTKLSKRIEFLKDGNRILGEARKRYGGRPYRLITDWGDNLILPADRVTSIHLEKKLALSPAVHDDFHADVAGFSPYGLAWIGQNIARKHLTKSINEILVPLSNETNFAIKHIFGEKWTESIVMKDVLSLISRISSRVFLGEELCRNEAWLRVTRDWTVQSFEAANLMTVCPGAFKFLMPRFSKKCKNVLAIYNEARGILEPVIERRRQLKAEAKRKGTPIPIFSDAIEWAEIESRGNPYSAVDCQLNLSFAAIHTSSGLLSQVLTRLSNEPHLITPLRHEIIEVLTAEGMNKNSLYNLKLMDSALKETQRIKPDQMLNLRRMATDNVVTSDGLEIKKGQRVVVDLGNMVDSKSYSEPEKFDIYRYYNWRQDPATAVKSQLVATSADNLTFGHGNHACPGRFFAANELKLALCHLLLKYDWELSPDASLEALHPAAVMSILNPSNKIRFRRRKAELDIDGLV